MDTQAIAAIVCSSVFEIEDKIAAIPKSNLDEALCICIERHGGTPMDLFFGLIKAGANPNALYKTGMTVMQLVIRHATPKVSSHLVRGLLDAGASPNLSGEWRFYEQGVWKPQRMSPLALCASFDYSDMSNIAELLILRGALPITKEEAHANHGFQCKWYPSMARRAIHCSLATVATRRALSKTGRIHKDVIPLIAQKVWETCGSYVWWLK